MAGYSVFSVENPLVDLIAHVDAPFLAARGKRPGTMHLVDEAESASLAACRAIAAPRTLPGGSAANTLRGVAWLNRDAALPSPVFGGAVGRDALGDGYREDLAPRRASSPCSCASRARTGTSIILVTPDGERTMNTHLGACRLFRAVRPRPRPARPLHALLYLTGYLWDTENQREAAERAAAFARSRGIPVAFDLADPWAVERYQDRYRDWVPRSVDVLFANGKELALLTGAGCDEDCMDAARGLAPLVVMKVGAGGCWVGGRLMPRAEMVPTEAVKPLDTTGAGDAFAGGWLYGQLLGRGPLECADIANRLAGRIVGVYGCDYEAVGTAVGLTAALGRAAGSPRPGFPGRSSAPRWWGSRARARAHRAARPRPRRPAPRSPRGRPRRRAGPAGRRSWRASAGEFSPMPAVNTRASRRPSSPTAAAAACRAALSANISRARTARALPASAARSMSRRSLLMPLMPFRPELR